MSDAIREMRRIVEGRRHCGMGLRSICDRALDVGGTATIDSRAGIGTTIATPPPNRGEP